MREPVPEPEPELENPEVTERLAYPARKCPVLLAPALVWWV